MKALIAAAGLATALGTLSVPVSAEEAKAQSEHTFTGNVSLASEYRYRGIAQTNSKPAVQGGFDYAHASGFYAGVWGSNVSWLSDSGAGAVSNSLEVDVYGGYKGTIGDFGYDVGLLQYWYPGKYPTGFTSPDTLEAYVAGTWQMFTLKYSHATTNLFGAVESKGAGYLDLSANFELGEGFTLVTHVGHQAIPAGGGASRSDRSYTDWKVGVNKDVAGVTLGLSYIDTNARGDAGQFYRNAFDRDLGRGTVLLSVSKTF